MTHLASVHDQYAAFCAQMSALPDVTSTTPGPKCPRCGLPFIVARGRHTGKWHVLHAGGPNGAPCPRYGTRYLHSETQEAAIALAKQLEESA